MTNKTSGWWFGCHFLFSHILVIIIPIDVHIFQRGSNHQPDIVYVYIYILIIKTITIIIVLTLTRIIVIIIVIVTIKGDCQSPF